MRQTQAIVHKFFFAEPPCVGTITFQTMDESDQVNLPVEGVLNLHAFRPADVEDLVTTYLAECRARGILQVRIIHGKGIGALRETVHATLRRLPEVVAFDLAPAHLGGWGATVVMLRQ